MDSFNQKSLSHCDVCRKNSKEAGLHWQRCADAHFEHWHLTVNSSGIGLLPLRGIKRSSTSSKPNEVGSTFSSCVSPCLIGFVAYIALLRYASSTLGWLEAVQRSLNGDKDSLSAHHMF